MQLLLSTAHNVVCLYLQQGNEEALVGQVRQQFRMNMHETDEAKVGLQLLSPGIHKCASQHRAVLGSSHSVTPTEWGSES